MNDWNWRKIIGSHNKGNVFFSSVVDIVDSNDSFDFTSPFRVYALLCGLSQLRLSCLSVSMPLNCRSSNIQVILLFQIDWFHGIVHDYKIPKHREVETVRSSSLKMDKSIIRGIIAVETVNIQYHAYIFPSHVLKFEWKNKATQNKFGSPSVKTFVWDISRQKPCDGGWLPATDNDDDDDDGGGYQRRQKVATTAVWLNNG